MEKPLSSAGTLMAKPSTTESSTLYGMALAAMAFALLTSVDTIFKLVSAGLPAHQILFINAFFALIPISICTFFTGGLVRIKTTRLLQHLARGGASVMSAFAAIFAYSRLPLTDFYAIVFAGPFIVTAMSAFWLGEKVDTARWIAILIGFAGVVVVSDPFGHGVVHGNAALLGRIAAFISIFCYALSTVIIRRMRLNETNIAFAFYGYIACILVSGVVLWLRGGNAVTHADLLHLALSGVLAGTSSLCLMTAYHRTPVALVAPFQYTQIIWGAVAGYLLWHTLPDARLMTGAAIVAASGMFVIYREIRAQA
ncbi:MAG TPA: DMT family transporter [Alphaproteobacteria bacterium]|nr:DMT family transporter [Alphaproteobacteria bacterium]